MKTVLVLAPHPDDGELSSGGSICRFIEEKMTVWYAAFSPCKKSVPEGFDPNILYRELEEALVSLGIDEDKILTFDYPVRDYPKYRQEILEDLIVLKNRIKPDLVLLPNSKDVHQDHHQIFLEGRRAFKNTCILGYELPWNSDSFTSNYHIRLTESHIKRKIKSLQAYRSQGKRHYFEPSFIESWARMRGTQIQEEYAEAFEFIRWVL